jgi:hypothetical protein
MILNTSSEDDEHNDAIGPQSDEQSSHGGSTLVLSLYLIDSEDDLLHLNQEGATDINKRARLYKRLCQACTIANDILRRSSSPLSTDKDVGKRHDPQSKYYYPWSSGGDGPIFGVHCDIHSDENFINATNDIDGDDMWQSKLPTQFEDTSSKDNLNADHRRHENRKIETIDNPIQHQPHLRAVCHYNNDVNDMWRCISLALQISSALSNNNNNNLSCAIECWDMNDGHILLIEAAEHLPSWVDDDTLQGGVGGPKGCRNRCWIVNGMAQLIPPSKKDTTTCMSQHGASSSSSELSRNDALSILMKSIQSNADRSLTSCPDAVQRAIEYRINRTDYSCTTRVPNHSLPEGNTTSPHWHTAAVALPASVARFVQNQPYLVPLLVDSFCDCAPAYLRELSSRQRETRTSGGDATNAIDMHSNQTASDENTDSSMISTTLYSVGNRFPYEEIVLCPIIFTRTNYAELVTGRGIVPTFPVPTAYRSVELNRFQRQLRQSAFGCDHLADDEERAKRRRNNPFYRAVDVGIRLCAGLDWILSNASDRARTHFLKDNAMELNDSEIHSLGEVERRLRIYWTMIDAEATGSCDQTQLPWTEQVWHVGPNGGQMHDIDCDQSLIQALQSMAKCHVFNPELCKPLWKEPCPYTRPGLSLLEMAKSGMKKTLDWQQREYNRDSFPVPRVWEVDDDSWMEVDTLEELEDEMKRISNREVKSGSQQRVESNKPRRTTRRSRRNVAQGEQPDEQDEQQLKDAKSATKMLAGIRSFVEGEGELEGAVTNDVRESTLQSDSESSAHIDELPEIGKCQEVNINPRRFLNILHSMLHDQCESDLGATNGSVATNDGNEESTIDDNISKFFFQEDLDNGSMSDESDCEGDDIIDDENDNPELQDNAGEDPWSLQNIMVRAYHC